MTLEDLKTFKHLTANFEDRCYEIKQMLIPLNEAFRFVDDYRLLGETVFCEGDEFWSYNGHEKYTAHFPAKLLISTDDEVKLYVANELLKKEKIQQGIENSKKILEKRTTENEIELYKKLKEKYEGRIDIE